MELRPKSNLVGQGPLTKVFLFDNITAALPVDDWTNITVQEQRFVWLNPWRHFVVLGAAGNGTDIVPAANPRTCFKGNLNWVWHHHAFTGSLAPARPEDAGAGRCDRNLDRHDQHPGVYRVELRTTPPSNVTSFHGGQVVWQARTAALLHVASEEGHEFEKRVSADADVTSCESWIFGWPPTNTEEW